MNTANNAMRTQKSYAVLRFLGPVMAGVMPLEFSQ